MKQLDYDLLFRVVCGLNMDDAVWDASTISSNRDRLLDEEVAQLFLQGVLKKAQKRHAERFATAAPRQPAGLSNHHCQPTDA